MAEVAPALAPAPTPSLEDVQTLLRPDRADRANRLSGITPGESNSEEEEEPELAAIEDGRVAEAALIAEGERRLKEEEPQSPQPPAQTNLDVLLWRQRKDPSLIREESLIDLPQMLIDRKPYSPVSESECMPTGAKHASRECRLPDSPTRLENFISIPQIRPRIMYAGIWDLEEEDKPVSSITKSSVSPIENLSMLRLLSWFFWYWLWDWWLRLSPTRIVCSRKSEEERQET